jgi:hypothetical protein
VKALVPSQEGRPQSHLTQRQIAQEVGISQTSVNEIVKIDLRLKCFKERRMTDLTKGNKHARLEGSRQSLTRYPAHLVHFIWFTYKKLFTVASPSNCQNYRLYAAVGTFKKNIPRSRLLRKCSTFSQSIMVSVSVSALGRTGLHFVEPGVKISSAYYWDVSLMQILLPDIQ